MSPAPTRAGSAPDPRAPDGDAADRSPRRGPAHAGRDDPALPSSPTPAPAAGPAARTIPETRASAPPSSGPRDASPPPARPPLHADERPPSPLRAAARWLAEALYPPVCINCRAEVETPHGLCPDCWRATAFIAAPVCDRCGAPTLGPEDAEICDACLHQAPSFRRARAAVLYDGIGRRLALALKHGDRLDIARPAALWMRRAGRDLIDGADLIAPVPLHWTRLARRRSNQAAELAREIARLAGRRDAFAPALLRRTRATASQGGRSREGRRANLAGAIAVSPRWTGRLAGRRVLLVDDVMTSGATLSACADALRAEGAEADALVLARVAPEREGPIFLPSEKDKQDA